MTTPSRLHRHMAQIVSLEASIEKTLDQLSKQASDHPDVAALVRSFHEMSGAQRLTLEARLHAVAGDIAIPDRTVAEFDGGGRGYPRVISAPAGVRCPQSGNLWLRHVTDDCPPFSR